MKKLRRQLTTFNEDGDKDNLTNEGIRKMNAHMVDKFEELRQKISYISYNNPRYNLVFRGQTKDYTNIKGESTLLPSIFRPKTDKLRIRELKDRLKRLRIAEKQLTKEWDGHEFGYLDDLERSKLRRRAILQHYGETINTPLLDITQSLQVASFFAQESENGCPHIYVLAFPKMGGAVSMSVKDQLQIINLSNICPPAAKRAHYQEGLLAGEYPSEINTDNMVGESQRVDECDFGRRLIAKFKIPHERSKFWDTDSVQRISRDFIFPTDDKILALVKNVQQKTESIIESEKNDPKIKFNPLIKVIRETANQGLPVTFFSGFDEYRSFAIDVSEMAEQQLIWTMFGSPLEATESISSELTKEDEFFKDVTPPKDGKYRLVVFSGQYDDRMIQIENYLNKSDSPRVVKFEESVEESGGKLIFTSIWLLLHEGLISPPAMYDMDLGIVLPSDGEGIFFESACPTDWMQRYRSSFHTTICSFTKPSFEDYKSPPYSRLYSDIPDKRKFAESLVHLFRTDQIIDPFFYKDEIENLKRRVKNVKEDDIGDP